MIVINNLNTNAIDFDNDYVYIQSGTTLIQISRVVVSRINSVLPDDEVKEE